jgi:hypothetical protein
MGHTRIWVSKLLEFLDTDMDIFIAETDAVISGY